MMAPSPAIALSTSLALTLPWRRRRVSTVLYAFLILAGAGWLIHALTFGPALEGKSNAALPAAFGLALLLLVVVSLDRVEAVLRRMSASSDLGMLFDPGHSIDASLYGFARTLRACLEVDECIVVLQQGRSGGPCLYMMDGSSAVPRSGARLDAHLADALLALPAERAVLFSRGIFSRSAPRCRAYDHSTLEPRPEPSDSLVALGHLLEAKSFVSVPLRSRSQALGRVYLLSHRRRLARRDARHLANLAAQAGPLIENMQLVEKLAQSVATQERRRISRDLHDGTVQPYIGLKLGLEALRRRLAPEAPLAGELDELVRMAADGISQLRSYVGTLSQPQPGRAAQESLVHGLRQQVENFSQFYDIGGTLSADQEIVVPAKLYDEILYIVREGLSNIRRHTAARRASVTLRREAGRLRIEIANDNAAEGLAPFHPRSIAERARELGGRVAVELRPGRESVVAVQVPF
jgi:signal transduction histidine kinase